MQLAAALFLAISLALDAFAVAVALATAAAGLRAGQALKIGFYFGGFQWMMTMTGWLLGHSLSGYLLAIDHWCVFGILALIGGKMVREARRPAGVPAAFPSSFANHHLIWLALAVSIDALAAGVGLALLQVDIGPVALLISLVAFLLAALGAALGRRLRHCLQQRALLAGGIILIIMGFRTLIEHLFLG